jgi:hypothetical protein
MSDIHHVPTTNPPGGVAFGGFRFAAAAHPGDSQPFS